MSFVAVVALALAVAMDATAVAAARGVMAPRVHIRDGIVVGLLFGGAQGLMPLLGWVLGSRIGPLVARWDHWIAFALLAGIGAKMLFETVRQGEPEMRRDDPRPFGLGVLTALAVATSIDAFAVGITLPMLGAPMVLSIVTMAITTAVLSGVAVFLGRRLGTRVGRRLDAVGGFVLIVLGVKILVEHLRAG
jgi:manganese efflux pump family protein